MKSTPETKIARTEITRACSIVGRQAALAAELGVSPGLVNQWVTGRRPIDGKHGPRIEELTGGLVLRERVCPEAHQAHLEFSRGQEAPPSSPMPAANRRAGDPDPGPEPGAAEDPPPSRKNMLECRVDQPPLPEHPQGAARKP